MGWVCTDNKVRQQIRSLLSYSKKHVQGVNKGGRTMNRENAMIPEITRM